MAPSKKEKVVFINVRVPLSRYKEIKRATKAKGVLNPTEYCRQVIYADVDAMKQQAAA